MLLAVVEGKGQASYSHTSTSQAFARVTFAGVTLAKSGHMLEHRLTGGGEGVVQERGRMGAAGGCCQALFSRCYTRNLDESVSHCSVLHFSPLLNFH